MLLNYRDRGNGRAFNIAYGRWLVGFFVCFIASVLKTFESKGKSGRALNSHEGNEKQARSKASALKNEFLCSFLFKFCFVVGVRVIAQNIALLSNFTMHSAALI
jgi:hypothetical protein